MTLLRIRQVTPLDGWRLRLTLTDGSVVEREIGNLMVGPVFEPLKNDLGLFRQVRAEHGTVVWPMEPISVPIRSFGVDRRQLRRRHHPNNWLAAASVQGPLLVSSPFTTRYIQNWPVPTSTSALTSTYSYASRL